MATSGRRLTAAEERELIRLRCLGWSIRAVAREMRLRPMTVWKYAPAHLVVRWLTEVEGVSADHIPADPEMKSESAR